MSGGGSGGGTSSSNTVTQVQQIPQYEQDFSQANQNLSASLGSQPYPLYQAPLIAGFTPQQQAGMQMAGQAATIYQPDLGAAEHTASNALSANPMAAGMPGISQGASAIAGAPGTAGSMINNALAASPANQSVLASYMSPYVMQALQPQITALNTQIGQQHQANAAGATGAGAFGDARQGSYDALTDFYGNQALSGLVGQGYNTAFGNALNTATQEQGLGLQGANALGGLQLQSGQALGNLGLGTINAGQQQQNIGLQGANLLGNLGQLQQNLGITGSNALFNAGTQQQTQQQQALNTAYQQFLNQTNWPFQMLNVRESALSNSPYNIANSTTLPNANSTAQTIGGGLNIAGLLGSLGSGNNAPFGGQALH